MLKISNMSEKSWFNVVLVLSVTVIIESAVLWWVAMNGVKC